MNSNLGNVSTGTYMLVQWPFLLLWLVKGGMVYWIKVINASLRKHVVFIAMIEMMMHLFLNKPSIDPAILDNFHPGSNLHCLTMVSLISK